jgi:site-specific DNA-methyltransferase (adenine-specific)
MVCAFEDAGFDIKDQIMWVYGQGFPKSYNISKGFDKQAGVEREIIGKKKKLQSYGDGVNNIYGSDPDKGGIQLITAPTTDLAKQWDGFGTALKPTHEPIMVAQKPIEKNYCYNVEKWGVGGLNIDGCRIELNGEVVPINKLENWSGFGEEKRPDYEQEINTKGRYPSNTIFDEVCANILDDQSGFSKGSIAKRNKSSGNTFGTNNSRPSLPDLGYLDEGGASRFFYCAKANKKDRTENGQIENSHPTVKPTELMKQLIKMVTPPEGINLDICEGSGTSGKASVLLSKEGYKVKHIGFENDEESYKTAIKRIKLNL